MSGINKVLLIGHLSELPQLTSRNGLAYTTFQLGTSNTIKKGLQLLEQTEWHQVIMTGSQAELAVRLFKAETLIFIEGKLRTKKYQDGTVTRYETHIVALNFKILGRKSDF